VSLTAHVRVDLDGFTLDAAFSVDPGETVALVGPNGAGKTTLLRALAGLRPLTAGYIHLDGTVLDEPSTATYLPPEKRPVGVVFQDNLLFPHLDALENVAFGLRTRGHGRRNARRQAAEWLERVGLADRLAARPGELSGGQAQRVALARALAPDPALLLLDEPLAALDATTRNEVRGDLRRHLATFPGERLLVTHDPVDAAVLADRVVVLVAGRIAQIGTPGDITARPRTPWVAALAGTNLYTGTAARQGGMALDGGGHFLLADTVDPGPVFAAIHPRAVTIHGTRPQGSARNTWTGRITAVEPVGDRLRVQIDGTPPIVAEVTAGAVRETGLTENTMVWVAVKAAEIVVYPA